MFQAAPENKAAKKYLKPGSHPGFHAMKMQYFHESRPIRAAAPDFYAQLKTPGQKHGFNALIDVTLYGIHSMYLFFIIFNRFNTKADTGIILTRTANVIPHLILLTELSTGQAA